MPPEGMLLTDRLAERLGVRIGDTLVVEVLDGQRATRSVPVVGVGARPDGPERLHGPRCAEPAARRGRTRTPRSPCASTGRRASALFRAPQGVAARGRASASKAAMLHNFRETTARNVLYLHHDPHRLRRGHRGRRRLQQRADRAAGARVGAREPARARASRAARSRCCCWASSRIELAVAMPLGCLLGYLLSLGDRGDEPHRHDRDPDGRRAAHLCVRRRSRSWLPAPPAR